MDGLLQHVLDSINQAVVAFDDELRLIAVNRKFIELLDLPEELARIGTPFGDLIRHNDSGTGGNRGGMTPDEAVARWLRRAPAGGGAAFEVQRTPLPGGGGFVLTCIDVTGRERRERMLEESRRRAELAEARLRDAIESLPEAFALFDADDRLVVFNSAFVDLFRHVADRLAPGVAYEDIVRTLAARGRFPEEFADAEAYIADRLASRCRPDRSVSTYRHASGRWVRATDTPNASGGRVNVWVDISPLKEGVGVGAPDPAP